MLYNSTRDNNAVVKSGEAIAHGISKEGGLFVPQSVPTFTASSLRIWNSSTGIPSPPLALFVVMLSKAPWLHIPGCLALGQWSHHCDYLGCEDFFCTVLLCIPAASSSSFFKGLKCILISSCCIISFLRKTSKVLGANQTWYTSKKCTA